MKTPVTLSKRDIRGMACAAWLGAVVYAAFRLAVEIAALRSGTGDLSGEPGAAAAVGYLPVFLEQGAHIFLLVAVITIGPFVLLYHLAEIIAEKPGQPFAAFVTDCFVRGDSLLPLLAARALLSREEIERRRMLAEQFVCMALGILKVEREGDGSRFVLVEDASAPDQGRLRVHETVLRRMGCELTAALPQERRAPRIAYEGEEREAALRILVEAFGLLPAPLSLGVEAPAVFTLSGASVETS